MPSTDSQLKNPYPAIDLRRAYNYLLKLTDTFPGKNTFGRKELLEGMGFQEKNGTGHNVVGALSHFGLLRRETLKNITTYNMTQDAIELLKPETDKERWRQLAHKAAVNPILFRYLALEFSDNLPVGLEGRLIRKFKEVNAKNVKAIIYRYKESLKFVDSGLGSAAARPPLTEGEVSYVSTVELMDFPFPLSDGTSVVFALPRVLTKKDGDRIARYVKVLVETLSEEA